MNVDDECVRISRSVIDLILIKKESINIKKIIMFESAWFNLENNENENLYRR